MIPLILIGLSTLYLLAIGVMSFNPTSLVITQDQLNFGAIHGGVGTNHQGVLVKTINPLLGSHRLLRWGAAAEQEWLYVRPLRGIGKGMIQIGVKYSRLNPGNYQGQIRIFASKTNNSPQEIKVHLTVYEKGKSVSPFGFIDIPGENQKITSPFMKMEGWALDDIEVVRISIKRDPLPNESFLIDPDGLVFLGDAVFLEGSRQDVQQAFPGFPLNHRAGWLFLFGPKELSGLSDLTFEIHAIAVDKEGYKKDLGQRTLLVPEKWMK